MLRIERVRGIQAQALSSLKYRLAIVISGKMRNNAILHLFQPSGNIAAVCLVREKAERTSQIRDQFSGTELLLLFTILILQNFGTGFLDKIFF